MTKFDNRGGVPVDHGTLGVPVPVHDEVPRVSLLGELNTSEWARVEPVMRGMLMRMECIAYGGDDADIATIDVARPPSSPSDPRTIGSRLGRYVLLEVVGEGAMGQVWRAYDPKLAREVALKTVSDALAGSRDRTRTIREAQAMAQLSHRNVVAVYDTEQTHRGVVLVMEYVRGQTLRRWCRVASRSLDEILRYFSSAGRGLAAAHRAGLLHRDFKPANVLVSEDGEVKVTDFGLAKAPGVAPVPSFMKSSTNEMELDGLRSDLTGTGIVMGTPLYMAPEQHRGGTLGPAADQYSFCVALLEALLGRAPFECKEPKALLASKEQGAPIDGLVAPRWVVRALRRGLAVDPAARWPSMGALLEALNHPSRGRPHRLVSVVTGFGLMVTATIAWQAYAETPPDRCGAAEEHLVGVWDDERRGRIERVVEGLGVPHADTAWRYAASALDDYATQWTEMHREACEATAVHGEQSAEVLDARMACLARSRLRLDAAARVFTRADRETIERSHEVVGGLPSVSRCADLPALEATIEPPRADDAAAVLRVRSALARAEAHHRAGRYRGARHLVSEAHELAVNIEYPPLNTELWLVEGRVQTGLGDYEAAEATLKRALSQALISRQWYELHDTVDALMELVGLGLMRPDEALRYREIALASATDDPKRETETLELLAGILMEQGALTEAEALARSALERSADLEGQRSILVSEIHNTLGNILARRGQPELAEAELETALALAVEALGEFHPRVGEVRGNLGAVLTRLGRYGDAQRQLQQAQVIAINTVGPNHHTVAQNMMLLAQSLYRQRRFARAEHEIRASIEILEETVGPRHSDTFAARNLRASVLGELGEYATAEDEFRSMLAVAGEVIGAEHFHHALLHQNLAVVLENQGRYAEAVALRRRALGIARPALGSSDEIVLRIEQDLAVVLAREGAFDEALQLQERVLHEWIDTGDREGETQARHGLAAVFSARGELAAAQREYEAVLEAREATLPADDPRLARSRIALASVLLRRGVVGRALSLARAAWDRDRRSDIAHDDRAETLFVLARALHRSGAQPQRVQGLARRALASYVQSNRSHTAEFAALREWVKRTKGGSAPEEAEPR